MNIRLSTLQLFFLMFIAQTGTVFISFQTPLIREAGRESWLLFFCLGLLFLPHIWLFERFYNRFIWSRPISIAYGFYWFYICSSFTGKTAYTLNIWAFPETPEWIVISLIASVILVVVISKPATAINLGVILIPLILVFIIFVLMSTNDLIWTNFFPIGNLSASDLQKASLTAQFPFVGIELYLLLRLLKPGPVSFSSISIYSGVWLAFFMLMLVFPLGFFSLKEFEIIKDPIMYLLKSQEVTFVERLDLIFIYIWMAWSIIAVCIYAFAVIQLIDWAGITYYKKYALWLTVLFVIVSNYMSSKQWVEWNTRIIPIVHTLFAVILPVIIIISNKLRRRKNGEGIPS